MRPIEPETKYQYVKQIAALREENEKLHEYKYLAQRIFTACIDHLIEGKSTNTAWIVKQFQAVFK